MLGGIPVFDHRAGIFRCKGILHPDGDVSGHHRLNGRRIDDLGTEVGEFHGFLVGDGRDDLYVAHPTRIGGHHS